MSRVIDSSESTATLSRGPKPVDMTLYQGDTFKFYLRFGGTGLDMTGWTAAGGVKNSDTGLPVAGIITTTLDSANSRFLVSVDTEDLSAGVQYRYDVRVTDSAGNKRTFIAGKIIISEDIPNS